MIDLKGETAQACSPLVRLRRQVEFGVTVGIGEGGAIQLGLQLRRSRGKHAGRQKSAKGCDVDMQLFGTFRCRRSLSANNRQSLALKCTQKKPHPSTFIVHAHHMYILNQTCRRGGDHDALDGVPGPDGAS